MKTRLEIIYEDKAIVVVNKPPFLRSIPDRYAPDLPNVFHQLQDFYGEIFVVHRLDKNTSGLLVFAKTEAAHRLLSIQFENRVAEKTYLTLLEGKLEPAEGVIDKPIGPHPRIPNRMIIAPKGKPSKTTYRAVKFYKKFTLAEAKIETGRTHQIRVHFESIGYPLAVDEIYGRRKEIFFNDIKQGKISLGKEAEPRPLLARTALHAFRLKIQHPVTGMMMEWEAPLPKDFKALVNQLDRWGN